MIIFQSRGQNAEAQEKKQPALAATIAAVGRGEINSRIARAKFEREIGRLDSQAVRQQMREAGMNLTDAEKGRIFDFVRSVLGDAKDLKSKAGGGGGSCGHSNVLVLLWQMSKFMTEKNVHEITPYLNALHETVKDDAKMSQRFAEMLPSLQKYGIVFDQKTGTVVANIPEVRHDNTPAQNTQNQSGDTLEIARNTATEQQPSIHRPEWSSGQTRGQDRIYTKVNPEKQDDDAHEQYLAKTAETNVEGLPFAGKKYVAEVVESVPQLKTDRFEGQKYESEDKRRWQTLKTPGRANIVNAKNSGYLGKTGNESRLRSAASRDTIEKARSIITKIEGILGGGIAKISMKDKPGGIKQKEKTTRQARAGRAIINNKTDAKKNPLGKRDEKIRETQNKKRKKEKKMSAGGVKNNTPLVKHDAKRAKKTGKKEADAQMRKAPKTKKLEKNWEGIERKRLRREKTRGKIKREKKKLKMPHERKINSTVKTEKKITSSRKKENCATKILKNEVDTKKKLEKRKAAFGDNARKKKGKKREKKSLIMWLAFGKRRNDRKKRLAKKRGTTGEKHGKKGRAGNKVTRA